MTDDIHHPNDTENQPDNHQHAIDALHGGDLSRAGSLLDEARAAVERAQHDDTAQAYRETAHDCYD